MILFEGPSELDGAPIMVVATGYKGGSGNVKTGPMIQTWIMRADLNPWEASKEGKDSSQCGDCPHRWSLNGACYVNLRTVNQVYQAADRGSYSRKEYAKAWAKFEASKGNYMIRLGSYGDPAAVPRRIWDELIKGAKGHTGYTHQWKIQQGQNILDLCMASADTPEEAKILKGAGVRFFQVRPFGEVSDTLDGVVECLADAKGKTCAECRICYGTKLDRVLKNQQQPVSVYIEAHGARKKRYLNVVQ